MSIFKTAALAGVSDARWKWANEAVSPGDAASLLAEEGEVPSEEVSLAKRLLGAGGGALSGDVGGVLAAGLIGKRLPRLQLAALGLGPAIGAGLGSSAVGGSDLESILAAAGAGVGSVAGKGLGAYGAIMSLPSTGGKGRIGRNARRMLNLSLAAGLGGGTAGGLAGGAAGAGLEALRDDEG